MGNRQDGQDSLVRRIERLTEIPMLILALAYVVVFLLENMPGVSPAVGDNAALCDNFIIAVFAAELIVKVAVANNRLTYLRAHWFDVLIVLAPFLRPLRLLRILRLIPFVIRGAVGLRRVMGRYKVAHVLTVGLLSILLSAALMAEFERRGGGPIKGFGDALWWAIATITTVGYGDMIPVTPEGKAVAIFLMLVGISLFGVLTAGVAAYFVEGTVHTERAAAIEEMLQRVKSLESRIEEQNKVLDLLLRHRVKGKKNFRR